MDHLTLVMGAFALLGGALLGASLARRRRLRNEIRAAERRVEVLAERASALEALLESTGPQAPGAADRRADLEATRRHLAATERIRDAWRGRTEGRARPEGHG